MQIWFHTVSFYKTCQNVIFIIRLIRAFEVKSESWGPSHRFAGRSTAAMLHPYPLPQAQLTQSNKHRSGCKILSSAASSKTPNSSFHLKYIENSLKHTWRENSGSSA